MIDLIDFSLFVFRMENSTLKAVQTYTAPKPIPTIQKPPVGNAVANLSLKNKLLCAGSAACIADLITFPLDTAKVRLQVIFCTYSAHFWMLP